MSIENILNSTAHRPWKIPANPWSFYQEWNDVVFLHYQVELPKLKKFVPTDLEIDLFDGKPWVSVVAFKMEKIRPKNLQSFPTISNFHEINVRTYVTSNNKTGVYFLSIEGGKRLSCSIAKGISGLPYRFSKISRTANHYTSSNTKFNDAFSIEFEIGKEVNRKTELDKWLTERYALFQDSDTWINEFEIHHLEWPISEIELKSLQLKYPRFEMLLNVKPRKIHYSKGVKVLAWQKTKRKRETNGS